MAKKITAYDGAKDLLEGWITEAGWSADSMLAVVCDFIDTMSMRKRQEFAAYIERRAILDQREEQERGDQ